MTTLPTWLVVVLVLAGPVVAGIAIAASSALLRGRSRSEKRLRGLRREPERERARDTGPTPRGTASGGPREEATEQRPTVERRGFFSRLFGGQR